MSDLVDKIIVLFLILLLPINILISSKMNKGNNDKDIEVSIEEMDRAINELESKIAAKEADDNTLISIESVNYASSSGELVVTGQAPISNLNVMVSATVSNKNNPINNKNQASGSAQIANEVLGRNVEMVAVKTDEKGMFRFIRKINKEKVELIELRFDQDKASATIQYDFELDKRTL